MKVGFVGLGAMGLPMTRNLLGAGHEVTVASRSPGPVDTAVSLGARAAASVAELAKASEVVFLCVPNSPDVVQVIDGKNVPATGNVPVTSSVFVVGPGFVVKGAQFQYWLTPGEHTLKFAAVVNSRDTTTWLRPQVNFSPPDAGVLKLNVEAGKRYWIAAQVNPARPEIWQAVVYKTDDIPRYRPG